MQQIDTLQWLIDAIQDDLLLQQEKNATINLQNSQHILDLYKGGDWKDVVTFDSDHYTRYAVPMPTEIMLFDVYIIWWDYDQMSPIHDHASNGCIMKFLDGQVVERRYTKEWEAMVLEQERIIAAWETSYISDSIGYHAIGTVWRQRAVSLHVYSPAAHTTTYFHS